MAKRKSSGFSLRTLSSGKFLKPAGAVAVGAFASGIAGNYVSRVPGLTKVTDYLSFNGKVDGAGLLGRLIVGAALVFARMRKMRYSDMALLGWGAETVTWGFHQAFPAQVEKIASGEILSFPSSGGGDAAPGLGAVDGYMPENFRAVA